MDIVGIKKNMEVELNKVCFKHLHHHIIIIPKIIIQIIKIENFKSLKCKIEMFNFFLKIFFNIKIKFWNEKFLF